MEPRKIGAVLITVQTRLKNWSRAFARKDVPQPRSSAAIPPGRHVSGSPVFRFAAVVYRVYDA
jgi:hypothetical protein